jgi:hypothetical protein
LVETVQASEVADIDPGTPLRRITWIVLPCWEYAARLVAVHPEGTQVNTDPCSLADAFALLTE